MSRVGTLGRTTGDQKVWRDGGEDWGPIGFMFSTHLDPDVPPLR